MNVGIPGLLGLVFVTLKLTGVIAWSWLWVLAPFWIPVGIVAVLFLLSVVCLGLDSFIAESKKQRGVK